MNEYHVSFMVVYNETTEAYSPEEAVDNVASNCPYDIDGSAWVTNLDTGEEYEI
jgi:hypothetical protein